MGASSFDYFASFSLDGTAKLEKKSAVLFYIKKII